MPSFFDTALAYFFISLRAEHINKFQQLIYITWAKTKPVGNFSQVCPIRKSMATYHSKKKKKKSVNIIFDR